MSKFKIKKHESNFFDLSKRIGFVMFYEKNFDNPEFEPLQAVFSYFYPMQIEKVFRIDKLDSPFTILKMLGYSKYFRKLRDGEDIPEYIFELKDEVVKVSIVDVKENHIYNINNTINIFSLN